MVKIAVFASGSGTNFEAIVEACENGVINAKVDILICDRPGAYVIERAKNHNVDTFVITPKQCKSKADYEEQILYELQLRNISLICLAGYMRIITPVIFEPYKNRILNIHPALLPSFKGAHGIDDAFNFGVKVFGVTVHFIDLSIDGGTIVMQRAFEYYGDDRDEVEQKIHAIEHQLYPEAINRVLSNF